MRTVAAIDASLAVAVQQRRDTRRERTVLQRALMAKDALIEAQGQRIETLMAERENAR